MFENFVGAKVDKRRQRTRTIAVVSIVVHAGFLLGLLAHGFWEIERLGRPKREISLAIAPPLEVPEPPPAPSVKRPTPPETPPARKPPPELTQPPIKPPDDETPEIPPEEQGSDWGVKGAPPGNGRPLPGTGDISVLPNQLIKTPPPPPPAPVRSRPPEDVEPQVVEAQRIAGEKLIQPDDGTKLQMARDGQPIIKAQAKMCLSASGDVARIDLVRTSNYPEYDEKILAAMQAWKYEPYLVDGVPTPVCTHVTFIYRQR